MQRLVDGAVGVAKESVKTLSREAFNNTINMVNGGAAVVLALVPNKASIMEGLQGWELRPTFKAPRVPRWLEEGASSLNAFIYDADSDSDSDACSEYESGTEDALSDVPSLPSSPRSSHSFYSSASTSFTRHSERRQNRWLHFFRRCLLFLFFPLLFWFPRRSSSKPRPARISRPGSLSRSSSTTSLSQKLSLASSELSRKLTDVVEYVTHLNDFRRRGVVEDLQLLMELAIERAFEAVRWVLHYAVAPLDVLRLLGRAVVGRPAPPTHGGAPISTLGDGTAAGPSPGRTLRFQQALNMDARTCADIVTEAGYPYEALQVTTEDGYVLLLERIPRRDSRRVVLLQHGLLDSSLGWVSNGVVGSQAFAAYDQGYDVWLGNMRGYASRDHVNPTLSPHHYWRYSVNEHGMFDIGAMVKCIHATKGGEGREGEEYCLSGVAHSLGGAAMLTYLVTQCIRGQPHHLARLILLSPAGFHEKTPLLFDILKFLVPYIDPFMRRFIPGFYIPTRGLRLLFNKLAQDFQNFPALRALVQVVFSSMLVGGDSSDWVGALRQPHYNMYDMPGLSYRVMKHMAQMKGYKKFIMYDYGSVRENMEHYGQAEPLDLGSLYHLIDIPIDVVMGRKDHLIPPSMVYKHYEALKAAGRSASIKEFEYAHLDFTNAHKGELVAYVMARLNQAATPSGGGREGSTSSICNANPRLCLAGGRLRSMGPSRMGREAWKSADVDQEVGKSRRSMMASR